MPILRRGGGEIIKRFIEENPKSAINGIFAFIFGAMIAFLFLAPNETPTQATQTTLEAETTETSSEPTPIPTATPAPNLATDYEIELIARTIWGEAGNLMSDTEKACVAWCVLNRVDAWKLTIEEVITENDPMQFYGYWQKVDGEIPSEFIELATDVTERWTREKNGETDVGRVLPSEYLYFHGYGGKNYFTTKDPTVDRDYDEWDFTLPSPYENDFIYGDYV